ncbi:MAG: hypothetical protein RL603_1755, partial [Pseudomonadota bacterium]
MARNRKGPTLALLLLLWPAWSNAQNVVTPSLLESRLQQIRQGQMNARTAASIIAATAARSSRGIDPIEPDGGDRDKPGNRGKQSKPSKGGYIPVSVPAPKSDDFGTPLGYCVSGKMSAKSGAGFNALAVIFAGPDRTFDTDCDQALQGDRTGDDYV